MPTTALPRPSPDRPEAPETRVELPVELVEANPDQVRRNVDREAADESTEQATLAELATSIRNVGLIQPIRVIPHPDPEKAGRYQIVAGERRFRAVVSLGWSTIAAVVDPALVEDAWRRRAIELAENTHRRALDWFDKARRVAELAREKSNLSQRELAQTLGVPYSRLSIYLALGNPALDPVTLAAVQLGLFTEIKTAYAFLNLPATRKTALLSAAQRKLEGGAPLAEVQLSRRRLEALLEAAAKAGKAARTAPVAPVVLKIALPAIPEPLARRLFGRLGIEFPDQAPGQVGARLIAALSAPAGEAP